MASRDIGASITAALEDLLHERAVIDDAIQKLQALIGAMQGTAAVPKRRGRPPGSGRKVAAVAQRAKPGRPPGKRPVGRPPGSGTKKKAAEGERAGWSESARAQARERMRRYWEAKRGGAAATSGEAPPRKKRGRPPKVREPQGMGAGERDDA